MRGGFTCLYALGSSLRRSARCGLRRRRPARAGRRGSEFAAAECKVDLLKYCGDVKVGNGRVKACLDKNAKSLSDKCKDGADWYRAVAGHARSASLFPFAANWVRRQTASHRSTPRYLFATVSQLMWSGTLPRTPRALVVCLIGVSALANNERVFHRSTPSTSVSITVVPTVIMGS